MWGEKEEQRLCLANEVRWLELVGRSPHIPEALRQCRTLKHEELWSCFRPILALWSGLTQFIRNLSLSLSPSYIPYNERKYLSSSSSNSTFLCGVYGVDVWGERKKEGGSEIYESSFGRGSCGVGGGGAMSEGV